MDPEDQFMRTFWQLVESRGATTVWRSSEYCDGQVALQVIA